jgi:hypothetical protein
MECWKRNKFDPFFSIVDLLDKETGWICHLSYTPQLIGSLGKVKTGWQHQPKKYCGKRNIPVSATGINTERYLQHGRVSLIADTIQFFNDRGIRIARRMSRDGCALVWNPWETFTESWQYWRYFGPACIWWVVRS